MVLNLRESSEHLISGQARRIKPYLLVRRPRASNSFRRLCFSFRRRS